MKRIKSNLAGFLFFACFAWAAQAADIDLQVPSYTWTPDPVVNGGTATFTITAQNNGPATSGAGTLTVALPSNVNYVPGSAKIDGVPGCSYSAPNLTCSISPLALGQTATVIYQGTGNGSGVQSTSAHLVETAVTNYDTNASNDTLVKSVTSIKGANLVVSHTGSNPAACTTTCTATAGSNYQFTVGVANNGPDAATTFKVTYDLPAATDFTFASANGGSDWSCPAPVGTTLTCTYSGANVSVGASAPNIVISGQIITTAGSITGGATVASTDSATGDPDLTTASNGALTRVVSVTPGTDLQTNKTMVSSSTGLTTLVNGEAVTLTLSAKNTGTQNASGVTITDTVPADFTIGMPPAGCSAVGQVITCTVGALNAGVTSASFAIPLTVVGAAGSSGTNTANVSRSGPAGGANTPATTNYSIVAPFVQIDIAKSKVAQSDNSPGGNDPVVAGQKIVNTVTVTNSNSSTTAATGTVTVVETLNNHPNETFDAVSSAGWACNPGVPAANQVTCSYAIAGSLARGASLPNLVFTTTAVGADMNLGNTICTGGTISGHSPADKDAIAECSSASIYSASPNVDIGITKVASDTLITTGENSVTYTIEVTNHGAATAPTIVVSDDIPMYQNISGVTPTNVAPALVGQGAGESCSYNTTSGDVTCTIKNLLAGAGNKRTINIVVTRPFKDGAAFTNTASWDSPDIVQTVNVQPDTAQATVQVDALADVTVTNIADAPDPVRVGMELTYTTSIKNIGASTAANVVLRHTVDTTKMAYVSGSATLTGTGGSCSLVTTGFVGAPHAGSNGIECTGFTLTTGESRQLTFKVIPKFSFYSGHVFPEAYSSDASITTTTTESNTGNNTASNIANVTNEQIDIAVLKQEAMGYDPDNAGPATNLLHDPVAFGDQIKYLVTFRNNGPSLATQVKMTDTLTPPTGWTANFVSTSVDTTNSTYTPVNTPTCSITTPGGGAGGVGTNTVPQVVTCYLSTNLADVDNILPSGKTVTLLLTFQTGGSDPPGSITYSNKATVQSAETGASPYTNDTLTGNNEVTETTTVLPKTDLYVTKAVSAGVDGNGSPYNINETFNYVLTVGNKGPSSAPGVKVTDTLPSGLVAVGNATASVGSGLSLSTNTCHNVAWSGSCNLGPIVADPGGADATKQVVITIPVRAVHPYSGALNSNISNTASVAPVGGASIDPEAGNNSGSVNVQIQASSIAGSVYGDNDRDDVFDAGEHINAVSITLTGTDSYGNTFGTGGSPTFSALTATTSGSGDFLFNRLPPGNWTLVETQPAGYFDRFETAGSQGGTIPANTCNGVANCSSSAAHNTISAITLPTATSGTGYVFQEYRQASVSGYVYYDADNNGLRSGAAETGISGIQVKLTGTDYAGQAVSLTATTNASGQYSFTSAPPSETVTGYTVEEQTQPAGYLDAQEQNGAGVVVASTANRSAPENFGIGVLNPNSSLTERNFGELSPATVSGYVFLDADTDAVRDGTELAGITGVTVTLTGSNDLGAIAPVTATTGAGGAYSFTNLRPGTYTVTETTPGGLTHTGAQAGSLGGTINAVLRTANTGVTGAHTAISTITVTAGQSATDNNFGESGQGISGYVYVDLDNDGVKDAGEPGISGIQVTLSGTASNSVNVCSVISPNPCTLTTDSSGAYLFNGLPASDATGYTLTEQSQASAPLSNYADGLDTAGTGIVAGGTAGNDVISGIKLQVGNMGVNYNFGERGASLAGRVYHDVDDNGSFNGSDAGLNAITVTLSGTTTSGANVCTVITSLYASCSVTTAADGTYSFVGLPSGSFTLTETQPVDYADRTTAAGTSGGGVTTGTAIPTIPLGAGVAATNYLFGEKTGSLSGYVYLDADNDGIKDAGESGISGVALTLSGTTLSGASVCTVCTTTSAADGSYSFTGLKNANGSGYTVTETQPSTYLDGKETAGASGGTVDNTGFDSAASHNRISAIAYTVGSSYTNYNFAEIQAATLSGNVFIDPNNNAVRDGSETSGITGVTITLTGTDDMAAAVNLTATTGANGAYSFTGLRPGTYTVTQTTAVSGMTHTGAQAGSKGGSGQAAGTGIPGAAVKTISNITLVFADNATGYNFGELGTASLSGTVYLDVNDNGARDGGDRDLNGVSVTLSGATAGGQDVCTVISPNPCTVATSGSGQFSFSGLPVSNGTGYTLTESQPADYADRSNTPGSAGGSASGGTVISGIVLASGTSATGYLFGEKGSSLSGTVYVDTNDNGVNDTGDSGFASVTMTLSGATASGADVCSVASCTATTGSNGSFTFSGLPKSNSSGYTLTETQPTGYADRTNAPGSAGGNLASGTVTSGIVLGAGVSAPGYLFGEKTGGLSGYVYLDINDNGVKDSSETGLANVTVTLSGTTVTGVDVCASSCPVAVTGADGSFHFPGLLGGTFTLTETHPTGYLDGKETAGTISGVATGSASSGGYDTAPANNRISNIVLPAGQSGMNYLFGERIGKLSGVVYFDKNNDGAMSGEQEIGLEGVAITLSGTTESGVDICTLRDSCTTVTDTSGAFLFEGVPPGTYELAESQAVVAASYNDGKETPGVAGGKVDNSGFGTNPGYNRISNILVDTAVISANSGNISGYLFGERNKANVIGLVPPIISGYVYRDQDHDRNRDTPVTDPNTQGWIVTLTAQRSDGSTEVICSVTTDDVGFYHLDNLNCLTNYPQWAEGLPTTGAPATGGGGITYTTFNIAFTKTGSGITTAPQSGGDAGEVDTTIGQIVGIRLDYGDNITEQNLPLDPSGVVYDAITRQPVAGAQVSISFGGALVPGACLLSGLNTVTTGANGFYQFLLLVGGGCPGSGIYTLAVTPPAGYASGVSTIIPPTTGPHVPPISGVDPIQAQGVAPAVGQVTTYFLDFNLTLTGNPATSSGDVVNNHIPIDPVNAGLLTVTKTTPLVNVARGDLVPYTINVINNSAVGISNINLVDLMPPGFKYRKGSATVDSVPLEPAVNNRELVWPNQSFSANQTKTFKLILMVGGGVGEGTYTNLAYATNSLTGDAMSNIASAAVRIVPDPTFDCSDIIGKVFDDKNTNGYQDDGEPGIPNVRIATPRGMLVVTDAEGRFHVACAEIPQADHGSNFVMKLDERTLPSGYRITTENPRDVRVTRGKMVKLNFGAALHRVVRLDVSDAAFEPASGELKAEWRSQFEALPALLKEKPSVLRLAYQAGADGKALAETRLKALAARMQALWKEQECCHLLQIEEELLTNVQEGK